MFSFFRKVKKKKYLYPPGRPRVYKPWNPKSLKPPTVAGEYRILSKDRRILYIGETNNLRRRINEHIRSGKISTNESDHYIVEYLIANPASDSSSRRVHERKKIAQHKPLLNKSKGGEGRISK